jgi:hypothetical protein
MALAMSKMRRIGVMAPSFGMALQPFQGLPEED